MKLGVSHDLRELGKKKHKVVWVHREKRCEPNAQILVSRNPNMYLH